MADSPRIEELRRRVQNDPASIAFAALAEEYRKAGRFDQAIATCLAGLQRHPAYLSAHVTLGRAFIEVGRYDDAREELEHVLRLAPENLAAIRGLAEIHHRRGELARAHHAEEALTPPAEPAEASSQEPRAPVQEPAPVAQVREPDPALARLESFLAGILRARDARRGAGR
jgi:tetratricopeptide (TPR) repeat protein